MSLKKLVESKSEGWQLDDQMALKAVLPGYELTGREVKEALKALKLAIDTNDPVNMVS